MVNYPDGSIVSYVQYKKQCVENNKKYIGRVYIYKQLKKAKEMDDIQKAYTIYVRQERAKLARRKNKI